MGFFEELGKKIGSATDTAADKAKKLAEVSRLKSLILAEDKQIDKLYSEIGKQIYERDKDDDESPVEALCKKITECEAGIAKYRKEIDDIKNDMSKNTKDES